MAIIECVSQKRILIVKLEVLFLNNERLNGVKGEINNIKEVVEGGTYCLFNIKKKVCS